MRRLLGVALCAALAGAAPDRPLAAKLRGTRISIDLEKASLDDFVKYVRAVSGINVVVRKHVIAKETDPEAIAISLKLDDVLLLDALELAFEPIGLGLKIESGVLVVTTKKDARGKPVLVIYDVADLLLPIRDFPAPDINVYPSSYEPPEPPEPEVHQAVNSAEELAELVRQFTGKETWEDDGVRITAFRRHLFIRQYPGVHREIAAFLNAVRGLR